MTLAIKSSSPFSSLLFAEKFPNFDAVANSNFFNLDASFILTSVPACMRSRILGTAGNIDGCTSARSLCTVSIDSAKFIVPMT